MEFTKTLIFTHRPVVSDGWYDDFKKIFRGTDYIFGSKTVTLQNYVAQKKALCDVLRNTRQTVGLLKNARGIKTGE